MDLFVGLLIFVIFVVLGIAVDIHENGDGGGFFVGLCLGLIFGFICGFIINSTVYHNGRPAVITHYVDDFGEKTKAYYLKLKSSEKDVTNDASSYVYNGELIIHRNSSVMFKVYAGNNPYIQTGMSSTALLKNKYDDILKVYGVFERMQNPKYVMFVLNDSDIDDFKLLIRKSNRLKVSIDMAPNTNLAKNQRTNITTYNTNHLDNMIKNMCNIKLRGR